MTREVQISKFFQKVRYHSLIKNSTECLSSTSSPLYSLQCSNQEAILYMQSHPLKYPESKNNSSEFRALAKMKAAIAAHVLMLKVLSPTSHTKNILHG